SSEEIAALLRAEDESRCLREDAAAECEWLRCIDPAKLLTLLPDTTSGRRYRLFAAAVCTRVWHLLTDERSRAAVEAVAAYADGHLSEAELDRVRRQANDAYRREPALPQDNAAYAAFCSCLSGPRPAASFAVTYSLQAVG